MAVEGIANLTANLANQFYGHTQETPAANTPAPLNAAIGTGTEDTFTPTAQNASAQAPAQDAGIFQINHNTGTAAGLNPLLATTATVVTQTIAAPDAPSSGATKEAATPLSANSTTAANSLQQPAVAPASAQALASVAATTAEVQNKLRALNAALPALGLTNEQIQQIDRIASLVQNFNPAAYQNL